MGRQWLHAKKEVTANRRAQMTSKLVREIMVAAKMGVPDPGMNPRLQLAVDAARKQSVSNDVEKLEGSHEDHSGGRAAAPAVRTGRWSA